jgi:hypothetical protein
MANIGRKMIYLRLPGCYQKYIFGDATLFKRKDNMPSRRYFSTGSTLEEMKGSPT